MMEIADSARKRGVSDADIRYAVAKREAEVIEQRTAHFAMLIGPARSGVWLEIGVLDLDDDNALIIHAMRLRRNWRRYLPEELR